MATSKIKTPASRPPVITILGHVDHGKTSLLDKIRNSKVAVSESGGITQHTSAYQVQHQDHLLTFIDTPGHAAFTQMRQRGGQIADIAILVIAADDGVMPQTKESLQYIKQAKIPYLVAINKIDLEGTNVVKIKTQLAEDGEYVEGFGGNIPVVEVSAKTGQGIDTLLETLILLAELEQLKDTSQEPAQAVVLESLLHPQKGSTATILVKSGILTPNQSLFLNHQPIGKIRAMFDFNGKPLKQAPPSTPIQIIGLAKLPQAGDILTTQVTSQLFSSSANSQIKSSSTTSDSTAEVSLNIIIKTDVAGTLEAIAASLPEGVSLVSSGVGQVDESDINSALINAAEILTFNAKTPSSVKKLAQIEKISIKNFSIIYELLDYLQNKLELVKQKEAIPQEIGTSKLLKIFNIQGKTIYGCQVLSGKVVASGLLQDSQIISLKQGQADIAQAIEGEEFGAILSPPLDVKAGDILKSYNKQ